MQRLKVAYIGVADDIRSVETDASQGVVDTCEGSEPCSRSRRDDGSQRPGTDQLIEHGVLETQEFPNNRDVQDLAHVKAAVAKNTQQKKKNQRQHTTKDTEKDDNTEAVRI